MPKVHDARGAVAHHHCNADRLNTARCLCTPTTLMRRDNKATSEIIKPPVPLSSPTVWRIERYNARVQRAGTDAAAHKRRAGN
jgi:hypothetical protein